MTISSITVNIDDILSYIVIKDFEGNYIDHVLNHKPTSERYLETFEDIRNSDAKNIIMAFNDLHSECIVSILKSQNGFDKFTLEEYSVSEFNEEFEELFD